MATSSFMNFYCQQKFSIPNCLIYYISHESPEILKKLLLTCKYFYLKYKIIPCDVEKECHTFIWSKKWEMFCAPKKVNSTKIWIFGGVYFIKSLNISQIASKVYRSDIEAIRLMIGKIYYFDDLKILFTSTKLKLFHNSRAILYSDGTIVPVENILDALPYVETFLYFWYDQNYKTSFNSESAQNFLKIKRFSKFKEFRIYDIPTNFHLPSFKQFVKKYASQNCHLTIYFEIETENQVLVEFKNEIRNFVSNLEIEKYK